jgi:type IV pilus assembly protein PilM
MVAQSFSDFAANISNKFSSKKLAVGVDISTKSIKAVVLEREADKIILKNYSIARSKNALIEIGNTGVINDFAGAVVKDSLESAGIKSKTINVAIPSFTSLIITIEVPRIAEKEFEEAIRREVSKYIPVKIEDVVYDWQIIDEEQLLSMEGGTDESVTRDRAMHSGEMVKILVIAVMKEISGQYSRVLGANDLDVNLLEIDSISLTRALTRDKKGVYLILDIGHETSNILVAAQQSVLINRTIDIGGDKMTQVIADSMKIDFNRADQIKREKGVNVSMSGNGGNVLGTVLEMIIDEIDKTVKLFQSDFEGMNVGGILLTGGAASMIGLRESIQQSTGIETSIGNALEGIAFRPEIKDVLLRHASSLSIAIGLALANFEE